ncbi:hypothetical protein A9Q99_04240 [Gammaproteobacteria bacterium 45_16_T64]|nr:hypothetical protein A9Q99_04240 [Gammaproteobacteria bacterium 45_16_T64]
MNKNTKRSIRSHIGRLSALSLAVGATLFASVAHAQLTQNITIGNPKALALGNAVTADPPGIDSIHFNPAGLAKIKGRQRQLKVLGAQMTFETNFGNRDLSKAQTEIDPLTGEPGSIKDTYIEVYCNDVAGCTYPDEKFENTSDSTSKPLIMLPGAGLTEVPFLVIPLGGIAIEDPNYGWTFATAVYSPQAIGYERDADSGSAYQGQRLGITRLTYFSPSIGLQFSDELYVGASIGFSYQGFGVETKLRTAEPTLAFIQGTLNNLDDTLKDLGLALSAIGPGDDIGSLTLELEDPLSLTFNVGLLWEPTEWVSFGVVYQSEGTSNLEGDFKMEHSDNFIAMTHGLVDLNGPLALAGLGPFNGTKVVEGTAELELINPAHFAIGTSLKLFPNLKVNLDAKWTDYSAWENLEIKFDSNIDFLTVSDLVYTLGGSGFNADGEDNADPDTMIIQRQYESVWSWAIGVEYEYSDNLVLRFGYEPRDSAIPDDRVDILAPLAAAQLYTIGFGYQLDNYSRFDAAYGYLTSTFSADAGESENLNSTTPGQVVYNPYAFLDVESTTTAHIFTFTYEEKF